MLSRRVYLSRSERVGDIYRFEFSFCISISSFRMAVISYTITKLNKQRVQLHFGNHVKHKHLTCSNTNVFLCVSVDIRVPQTHLFLFCRIQDNCATALCTKATKCLVSGLLMQQNKGTNSLWKG